MNTLQKVRWETAMATFHASPVDGYKRAILRHQQAIKHIENLIKKLKSQNK